MDDRQKSGSPMRRPQAKNIRVQMLFPNGFRETNETQRVLPGEENL